MISAVLFDLDGTLLETEELKGLSYARAAELRPDTVREDDVLVAYTDDLVGHPCQEVGTPSCSALRVEHLRREGDPLRHGVESLGVCGSIPHPTTSSSSTRRRPCPGQPPQASAGEEPFAWFSRRAVTTSEIIPDLEHFVRYDEAPA